MSGRRRCWRGEGAEDDGAGLHEDGTIDAWARIGVAEAVAAGYVDGFPDGRFRPRGTATRAQAAPLLAMVL